MKLHFYANGASGNHGCEAITRSLRKIVNLRDSDLDFATFNIEEDQYYIPELTNQFISIQNEVKKFSFSHILNSLKQRIAYSDMTYYKEVFKTYLSSINSGDHYLSIGGDNYSYGASSWLYYLNSQINKNGGKTSLIGCSILESITDTQLIDDLSLYEHIVCRESLTYDALKESKVNADIRLIPDPAFQLDIKFRSLPNFFIEENTVGINVSPMIINYEKNKGITIQNYIELIQYILQKTDMNVALIPHVVWDNNDDRIPLKILYDKFKDTERICMIENHNAEELKGYIARCRFMIAARTHASIAAYSQCVPTLVVGYSVKAKGIAKDIFGNINNYVIPVQAFQKSDDLLNSFLFLVRNEQSIRAHLNLMMVEYANRALELKNIL